MSSVDRTQIAPLLTPHFPSMAKATSDEWHGFLNAMTGLSVRPEEPNANAFDDWRQALAEQKGIPVWNYTPAQIAKMQERGQELKRLEEARQRDEAERLKRLAQIAPTKTPDDLVKDAKGN